MSMTPERARELLALAPKDEFRVVTHRKMSGELTLIECGVFDYAAPPRCAELFAASVDALRAYLAAVERAEAAERERDALRALVKRYVEAHAARGEEGVAMTQPRTTLLVASPECIALGEASDEPQHPTKKEMSDAGLGGYSDCLDDTMIADHQKLLRDLASSLTKKCFGRKGCTDENNGVGYCLHTPEDAKKQHCVLCGKPLEAR